MKIALVGTAPSSVTLVPMADPSWTVWACSPGCAVSLPQQPGYRVDAWFEIHRWGPNEDWISAYFREFMRKFPNPVFVNPRSMPWITAEIPNAVAYPEEEVIRRFFGGRRDRVYFLTSSISQMFAKAIMEIEQKGDGENEIGIFGVDMSATEEWGHQRDGCHFFILEAERAGIKITVPPESDLLFPPAMYGLSEYDPKAIKWLARSKEIDKRIADAKAREAAAQREVLYLSGAADDIKYMRNTYL